MSAKEDRTLYMCTVCGALVQRKAVIQEQRLHRDFASVCGSVEIVTRSAQCIDAQLVEPR